MVCGNDWLEYIEVYHIIYVDTMLDIIIYKGYCYICFLIPHVYNRIDLHCQSEPAWC